MLTQVACCLNLSHMQFKRNDSKIDLTAWDMLCCCLCKTILDHLHNANK